MVYWFFRAANHPCYDQRLHTTGTDCHIRDYCSDNDCHSHTHPSTYDCDTRHPRISGHIQSNNKGCHRTGYPHSNYNCDTGHHGISGHIQTNNKAVNVTKNPTAHGGIMIGVPCFVELGSMAWSSFIQPLEFILVVDIKESPKNIEQLTQSFFVDWQSQTAPVPPVFSGGSRSRQMSAGY